MAEQGLVAVSREGKRRGVVQRYFAAEVVPEVDHEGLEGVEGSQRLKITTHIVRAILADMSSAATSGKLERQGTSAVRVPGLVDLQGWEELRRLCEEATERAKAIVEKAEPRADSTGLPVVFALLHFEASAPPP
jgi:hypothetical protein